MGHVGVRPLHEFFLDVPLLTRQGAEPQLERLVLPTSRVRLVASPHPAGEVGLLSGDGNAKAHYPGT